MADEYLPTTEDVRNHYAYGCGPEHTWQTSREDFDRWLAEHESEIRARAFEQAAALIRHKQHPESVRQMLVKLAAEVRAHGTAAGGQGRPPIEEDGGWMVGTK